jgi:hypothetical protein
MHQLSHKIQKYKMIKTETFEGKVKNAYVVFRSMEGAARFV